MKDLYICIFQYFDPIPVSFVAVCLVLLIKLVFWLLQSVKYNTLLCTYFNRSVQVCLFRNRHPLHSMRILSTNIHAKILLLYYQLLKNFKKIYFCDRPLIIYSYLNQRNKTKYCKLTFHKILQDISCWYQIKLLCLYKIQC